VQCWIVRKPFNGPKEIIASSWIYDLPAANDWTLYPLAFSAVDPVIRKNYRYFVQVDLYHNLSYFGPGGHLKIPHLWPGQNPPPGWRRDKCILALGGHPDNPRGGFLESPALSLEFEQVTVVHQPIEQRGRDDDIA